MYPAVLFLLHVVVGRPLLSAAVSQSSARQALLGLSAPAIQFPPPCSVLELVPVARLSASCRAGSSALAPVPDSARAGRRQEFVVARVSGRTRQCMVKSMHVAQYSTARVRTAQRTAQHCTTRPSTQPVLTAQPSPVQSLAVQYSTVQYTVNTAQYSTIQ